MSQKTNSSRHQAKNDTMKLDLTIQEQEELIQALEAYRNHQGELDQEKLKQSLYRPWRLEEKEEVIHHLLEKLKDLQGPGSKAV